MFLSVNHPFCGFGALIDFIDSANIFGLINGGTGGLIWVYIGTFAGFFASVLSMAEMASMLVAIKPFLLHTVCSFDNSSTSQGTYHRWSISLGIRVCSTKRAKVPQLHRWLAVCVRMASRNRGYSLPYRSAN